MFWKIKVSGSHRTSSLSVEHLTCERDRFRSSDVFGAKIEVVGSLSCRGPLTELLKNQIAPVVSRKLDSIEIIRAFDINLDSCTFPLNM